MQYGPMSCYCSPHNINWDSEGSAAALPRHYLEAELPTPRPTTTTPKIVIDKQHSTTIGVNVTISKAAVKYHNWKIRDW